MRSSCARTLKKTTLSPDISADAVERGGQKADGLKARLVYGKSRLRVSPVALAYLGGHIKGDVRAAFAHSPPTLKLEAAGRRLSLEQLFQRLDTTPAASGPLDLDLTVTAKGAGLHALLASMSGQASGYIRGGSLADRTVNLAGQHIVEWMFTRMADGAVAAKVVGDTIGLPFHLLGSIIGADGRPLPGHKPCVVVSGVD